MSGHNTDLALAGGDDTGAVGTDQARLALTDQSVLYLKKWILEFRLCGYSRINPLPCWAIFDPN